jgi:hypothetical protein
MVHDDDLPQTSRVQPYLASMDEARHSGSHREVTRSRWLESRNRRQEDSAYRDEWRAEQCGMCEFWIPLAGVWGLDNGACSKAASPFDGTIRSEHDGCDRFSPGRVWGIPEDFGPSVPSGETPLDR